MEVTQNKTPFCASVKNDSLILKVHHPKWIQIWVIQYLEYFDVFKVVDETLSWYKDFFTVLLKLLEKLLLNQLIADS